MISSLVTVLFVPTILSSVTLFPEARGRWHCEHVSDNSYADGECWLGGSQGLATFSWASRTGAVEEEEVMVPGPDGVGCGATIVSLL